MMRRWPVSGAAVALLLVAQASHGTAQEAAQALPGDSVRARARPRPVVALLEGLATNVVINRVDAWIGNLAWAKVTPRNWASNIRHGWAWDAGSFMENMFAHPLAGAMYFNAGRDNGLSFWEAAPLAFVGSATWEYFAETERASLNDLYNTSFGGIMLGEMGHRLADLVRDNSARGTGRVLRELAALPLDPVGGVNRMLRGDFKRVGPNPDDRDPSAFGLQLQAGARLAPDSGSFRQSSVSSTFLVDVSYGNAFTKPFAHPFDVFRVRLQVNPDAYGVSLLNARGRLYSHEFTDTTAAVRTAVTVAQRFEYRSNPAYRFGGPSVGVGFESGYAMGHGFDLRTEVYGEALILAGLDAPGAVGGSAPPGVRTYDFGPGAGLDVSTAIVVKGMPVFAMHWRWAYVHAVSGSPADHFVQFASFEAGVPVSRHLGVGAYAGYYQRHSNYRSAPREARRLPELRAYLTWRNQRELRISQAR